MVYIGYIVKVSMLSPGSGVRISMRFDRYLFGGWKSRREQDQNIRNPSPKQKPMDVPSFWFAGGPLHSKWLELWKDRTHP